MRHKVPAAKVVIQQLPMVPEIRLALIDSAYPQADLTREQIENLMDDPPYWAFCWASGQVMARYLLDNPEEVKGKTVVDFGTGSGVVAIAASLAGADYSVALDIDENALMASQVNAALNSASLKLSSNMESLEICRSNAILLIADVFYDRGNIPLLQNFIRDFADVIVADSRIKPTELTDMVEVSRYTSCTVPDLAEDANFNSVRIYRKRPNI
jgi:predicted nicotinamide N-methyase